MLCSYELTVMGKFALLVYMSEFRLRFVVLSTGSSKSNHLGAQSTFDPTLLSLKNLRSWPIQDILFLRG